MTKLIESLEIAKARIQVMKDKGMEIPSNMLQGLIDKADARIVGIKSGEEQRWPDDNAKYFAEVVIDLDEINEPMIADPDVDNIDIAKRYTHDTIRPISYYGAEKVVGFVGSCIVHKGDMNIIAQMFRNIENAEGKIEFNAPLVVAPPTYNIVDELKAEGDWEILQKYAGSSSTIPTPRLRPARLMKISSIWSAPAATYAWATKRRLPRVIRLWPHRHAISGPCGRRSEDKKGVSFGVNARSRVRPYLAARH